MFRILLWSVTFMGTAVSTFGRTIPKCKPCHLMTSSSSLTFETENFEGSGPQTPEVASLLTENGEVSRLPDDCTSLCHRDGNHSTAVGMYKSVKDVEELDSVWNMNSSLLKPKFESTNFGKAFSKRKRRQTNTEQTTETPTPVTSVILQVNPNITPGDSKSEMVTTTQAATSVTEVTQTEGTIKPGVTTADTSIEPTETSAVILGVSVTPSDVIVQPSKTSEQNSEVDTQPIQQTTETQTTDESSKEEDTEDTEDTDLENLLSFLGDEIESRLDYLNQELEKANDLMSCLLDVLLKQLLSTVVIPHKQDAWNNCIKSTYGSAVSETDVLSKIFLNLWKETGSEPEKIS